MIISVSRAVVYSLCRPCCEYGFLCATAAQVSEAFFKSLSGLRAVVYSLCRLRYDFYFLNCAILAQVFEPYLKRFRSYEP